MKRLCILFAIAAALASAAPSVAQDLNVRQFRRTVDTRLTETTDSLIWYGGESLDYTVYARRAGIPVVVPEGTVCTWLVLEGTNVPYIVASGEVASSTNGEVHFFVAAPAANLPPGDYNSWVALYQGTNRVGVLDRTAATVKWRPGDDFDAVAPVTNIYDVVLGWWADANGNLAAASNALAAAIAAETAARTNAGYLTAETDAAALGAVTAASNALVLAISAETAARSTAGYMLQRAEVYRDWGIPYGDQTWDAFVYGVTNGVERIGYYPVSIRLHEEEISYIDFIAREIYGSMWCFRQGLKVGPYDGGEPVVLWLNGVGITNWTDVAAVASGATNMDIAGCPAVTSATYNAGTRLFTLKGPALSGGGSGATSLVANIAGATAKTGSYDSGTATLTLTDLPAPDAGISAQTATGIARQVIGAAAPSAFSNVVFGSTNIVWGSLSNWYDSAARTYYTTNPAGGGGGGGLTTTNTASAEQLAFSNAWTGVCVINSSNTWVQSLTLGGVSTVSVAKATAGAQAGLVLWYFPGTNPVYMVTNNITGYNNLLISTTALNEVWLKSAPGSTNWTWSLRL